MSWTQRSLNSGCSSSIRSIFAWVCIKWAPWAQYACSCVAGMKTWRRKGRCGAYMSPSARGEMTSLCPRPKGGRGGARLTTLAPLPFSHPLPQKCSQSLNHGLPHRLWVTHRRFLMLTCSQAYACIIPLLLLLWLSSSFCSPPPLFSIYLMLTV